MTVDIGIAMQLLNLLLVPAVIYIVRLERRIYALELAISVKLDSLPCRNGGACFLQPTGDSHG